MAYLDVPLHSRTVSSDVYRRATACPHGENFECDIGVLPLKAVTPLGLVNGDFADAIVHGDTALVCQLHVVVRAF